MQAAKAGPEGQRITPEQAQAQQEQAQAQAEQRRLVLKQVLTTEASERLANVSLVKPDKARQVENYLIKAAQSGQLGGKVSEDQLKDILSQVTAQTQQRTKVTISRRRHDFDDDDDDDDDGW